MKGLIKCQSRNIFVANTRRPGHDYKFPGIINNIVDRHLGFDMVEIFMTKSRLESYLDSFCERTMKCLEFNRRRSRGHRNKNGVILQEIREFEKSIPELKRWLIENHEVLRFFATRNALRNGEPTITFAFNHNINSDVTDFIFIRAGLCSEKVFLPGFPKHSVSTPAAA